MAHIAELIRSEAFRTAEAKPAQGNTRRLKSRALLSVAVVGVAGALVFGLWQGVGSSGNAASAPRGPIPVTIAALEPSNIRI